MKKLDYFKILLDSSISLTKDEKKEILDFVRENPKKIDEVIQVFEEERLEIVKGLEKYFKK